MKSCRKCNQTKPLDMFPVRVSSPDGRRNECNECIKIIRQQKKAYDQEYYRTTRRQYSLKHRYGISEHDYQEMFTFQDGKCKLCDSKRVTPIYISWTVTTVTGFRIKTLHYF